MNWFLYNVYKPKCYVYTGIGHKNTVDIVKVPDAIPRGNFKPVSFPDDATIITFDLETTGLSK